MKKPFYVITIGIILFLFSGAVAAQPLILPQGEWSYIFKITEQEARQIEKTKNLFSTDSLLHTLVDSIRTDSLEWLQLRPGYYLKTRIVGHEMMVDYTFVSSLVISVVDHPKHFLLQITDVKGRNISNVTVRVKNRKLHYDKKTRLYKSSLKRYNDLLTITHEGQTYFYTISHKEHYKSTIKYKTRRLVNAAPVKYVWKPIRFIVRLPVDGVRSIAKKRPIGAIRQFQYNMNRLYTRITNGDGENHIRRQNKEFEYYFVSNKPIYRVGDTVFWKAYILNERYKPLGRTLEWNVKKGWGSDFLLKGEAKPYEKGGYAGYFVLHDSLRLKGSNEYILSLEEKEEYIANLKIRLEDYKLEKQKASIYLHEEKKKQGAGHTYELDLTIQDANGFVVHGTSLEVVVVSKEIKEVVNTPVFIPDTIFNSKQPLQPLLKQRFAIPDSIFPVANMDFTITATIVFPDNQRITTGISKTENLIDHPVITWQEEIGFLSVAYTVNGLREEKQASIYRKDQHGNSIWMFDTLLPTRFKIDPAVLTYKVVTDQVADLIKIYESSSGVFWNRDLIEDSLCFKLINPLKLQVSYFLFKNKQEVRKGMLTEGSISYPIKTGDQYELFYSYMWGGQIIQKKEFARDEYNKNELTIHVDAPEKVYPGQTAEIALRVTDHKGSPVRNLDVTAYGINSKFGNQYIDIPYFEPKSLEMGRIRSPYSLSTKASKGLIKQSMQHFPYDRYGNDTLRRYMRFVFPGKTIQRFEYPVWDKVTQFAPFVYDNGKPLQVHVIYVDNSPVYISWANNGMPYAFAVKPGVHEVKIHTPLHTIVLDSVSFTYGYKTCLSVDVSRYSGYIHARDRFNLPDNEMKLLHKYTMSYNGFYANKFAYVKSNERIFRLEENKKNQVLFIGPLVDSALFVLPLCDSFPFLFSPGYVHTFSKQVLEKTSSDYKASFGGGLDKNFIPSLQDEVLTNKRLDSLFWASGGVIPYKKYHYNVPANTSPGNGALVIQDLPLEDDHHTILMNMEDSSFFRVTPFFVVDFIDLKPGTQYRIILLYEDLSYEVMDSLQVLAGGRMYYQKNSLKRFPSDSLTKQLFGRVVKEFERSKEASEQAVIDNLNSTAYTSSTSAYTRRVFGNVTDENGEPLIGVNIVVKQQPGIGTVTDIDGNFALDCRPEETIEVSYIGFEEQAFFVGSTRFFYIVLNTDSHAEGELIVVGYGYSPERRVKTKPEVSSISQGGYVSNTSMPAMQGSAFSLRQRFEDYCFWQPRLLTDKNGQVRFQVQFPDDITQWETSYMAMNGKKQSGLRKVSIPSYKPIIGELSIPRFMVSGDTATVLGEAKRYAGDTNMVSSLFMVDGKRPQTRQYLLAGSELETYNLTATQAGDTLAVHYQIDAANGFMDGEIRKIPVIKPGVETRKGFSQFLAPDMEYQLHLDSLTGQKAITFYPSQLDALYDPIFRLISYSHLCNEQASSKLLAFLNFQQLCILKGESFTYEGDVKKLIRLLEDRFQPNRGWGWWHQQEAVTWISNHARSALNKARSMGYSVNINYEAQKTIEERVYFLETQRSDIAGSMDALHSLAKDSARVDYKLYVDRIRKQSAMGRDVFLETSIILYNRGIPDPVPDTLIKVDTTWWGNIYIKEPAYVNRSYVRQSTAYQNLLYWKWLMTKGDTIQADRVLGYFFEPTQHSIWQNTYLSSQVIDVLLPRLIGNYSKHNNEKATVLITGDTILERPASNTQTVLLSDDVKQLSIKYTGNTPLIMTCYASYWDTTANFVLRQGYSVTSNLSADTLQTGVPVTLRVKLSLPQDMEYGMLRVPIPASCSYDNNNRDRYRWNIHTDYLKEEAVFYINRLSSGEHNFDISLIPRFSGTYTLNPASFELMYYPELNCHETTKRIVVK